MTTEFLDHTAEKAGKDFSVEALRASTLQLAEALSKSSAEPLTGDAACTEIPGFAATPEAATPELPPNIHEHSDPLEPSHSIAAAFRLVERVPGSEQVDHLYRNVLRVLMPAVGNIAVYKNVTIEPDMCPWLARHAMRSLSPADMADVLELKHHAVMQARLAIGYTLDLFAAMQVGKMVVALLGDPPHSPAEMMDIAERWIARDSDPANPTDKIWPDLVQAVTSHLEALAVRINNETSEAVDG